MSATLVTPIVYRKVCRENICEMAYFVCLYSDSTGIVYVPAFSIHMRHREKRMHSLYRPVLSGVCVLTSGALRNRTVRLPNRRRYTVMLFQLVSYITEMDLHLQKKSSVLCPIVSVKTVALYPVCHNGLGENPLRKS